MGDVWPIVHRERQALIDDLEGLGDEQWQQPSLCAGWTVHDVVAHLVDTARTTRLGFVVGLARSRFDFHRQNARGVERERGASPQETLARLRAVASRTTGPPAPVDSRIVEEVVHGEDVRRPLGLIRGYPPDAVVRAVRLQARTPVAFGGAKEHLAALRLEAVDTDLTLGTGPVVRGPALELLLAVCGRPSGLDALEGPGVARLTGAMSTSRTTPGGRGSEA